LKKLTTLSKKPMATSATRRRAAGRASSASACVWPSLLLGPLRRVLGGVGSRTHRTLRCRRLFTSDTPLRGSAAPELLEMLQVVAMCLCGVWVRGSAAVPPPRPAAHARRTASPSAVRSRVQPRSARDVNPTGPCHRSLTSIQTPSMRAMRCPVRAASVTACEPHGQPWGEANPRRHQIAARRFERGSDARGSLCQWAGVWNAYFGLGQWYREEVVRRVATHCS